MGEQTNANGQLNVTIFPFVVQSIDGVPHLNSFGSLLKGSSGKAVYSNVLALIITYPLMEKPLVISLV